MLVEERLGQLHSAPQSARQRARPVPGAVGEPEAVQGARDPAGQVGPREAVEVPLVEEVFTDGELEIEGRRLEHHPQPPAHPGGVGGEVRPSISTVPRWAGSRVARMRNSVVFPPPLGPKKPKISPDATSKSTPASAAGCGRRTQGRGRRRQHSTRRGTVPVSRW